MADNEQEDISEFSMMDIASLDFSGIKALTGGGLPVGVYIFEAKKGSWEKGEDKQAIARWVLKFPFEVVEVIGLADDKEDPEALVGKKYTTVQYISLASDERRNEGIGYAKGLAENLGVDTDEVKNFGGVEGAPPGWLDAVDGFRFEGKIKSETGSDGVSRTRLDVPKLKK